MPSTVCTCIRTEGLQLVAMDPACPARSHLWDEIQSLEA